MDAATRMRNFSFMLIERLVKSVSPFSHGRVFEDPDLTDVWDNNFVLVETAGVEAAELDAEVDELQSHLGHRKLVILDADDGRRLKPGLVAAGYSCSRLVWMDLMTAATEDGSHAEPLRDRCRAFASSVLRAVNR